MRKLRILDLNTPWFWLTIFYYGKRYGEPSFELQIWSPHDWEKFWIHVWKWENGPIMRGMYHQEEIKSVI